MMRKSRSVTLWPVLKLILIGDAAIFGGVGLVCLIVERWRSLYDYANGLVLVSAAVLGIAAYSAFGGWQQTSSFSYQYSSTINADDRVKRAEHAIKDRYGGVRFILQAALIAALPLVVAFLLSNFVV
jgi:TRAP-type C4-dicarboxylate transport system permease small subunit